MHWNTQPILKYQRGAATLVVSLILLVVMTLVTLFTAKSMVVEQRISANDYRGKQAFEAADGGIEHGLALLSQVGKKSLENTNTAGTGNLSIDTNGDGTTDITTLTGTLANGGNYSVTFSLVDPTATEPFETILVTSVGSSDNGNRTASAIYNWSPFAVAAPPTPLVTQGSVTFGGNTDVRNTDTDAPYPNETIWSGGVVSLGGSGSTTTSDGSAGITESDSNLASASGDIFFQNFFGATKASVEAAATVFTGAGNYKDILNGRTGETLWVDGAGGDITINSNAVIGSTTRPVILIIENFADFKLNGTVQVYGVLYVMGDWANSGGGTAGVTGAVLVEGSFQSTGTPDLIYDTGILNAALDNGVYAKVPGSWRDF